MPAAGMRDLAGLPKAHLHVHIDGVVREQTLRELCALRGWSAPTVPAGGRFRSFADFMQVIKASHDVLSSEAGLHRIIGELMEDAAAEGVAWLELSVWPGLFGGRLGTGRDAVLRILEAAREATAGTGTSLGVMVAANRDAGPEAAQDTARIAAGLAGDGVVSFGLDGDEAAFPPALFAGAFAIASSAGLLATPHAGELAGADSVRAALETLHADRILHGVRAAEDPGLVSLLAASGTCLDVCPTSNFSLGITGPGSHPLPALLSAGVRCSVNADDPLPFGTTLLTEYELCRTEFGLDDQQIAGIATASIQASGAPAEVKSAATAAIARWLASP